MFITKSIFRAGRFLRGAGTALALPLLDAMIPALRAERLTAAAPVRRLGFRVLPAGRGSGSVAAEGRRRRLPVQ